MKIVFATNNHYKLSEVKKMLGNEFEILSLEDINCDEDIPETCDTLEGNASQKSWYIYNKYKYNCFSDDTGLEVEALNMEPGVYSARYAGLQRSAEDNMQKLLSELDKIKNRKARFRTVISLIINGVETSFEGIVDGEILHKKTGTEGFGYDPIFKPDGFSTSFAVMSQDEKNKISHRGRAITKLIDFLKNLNY